MANILKQSTGIDVRVGPFVDVTDAVSPETGVSLSTADQAELLKANGAATVDISGATWAAVTGADGWYDLTLTTSHTDTVGELVVVVQDSSLCLPVHARFQVVEEAIYDALFAASAAGFDANGRVDVASIAGTAQTARDIGASVLLSSGTGTGQVSLSSGTVTVGTNNDKTGYSLTATTGLGNQTANITGTLSGTVGGIAGTITTLDALDTAQDTQHSNTQALIGTPTDFGSGTSTLAANLQDIADNGTAVFDRSTDSLQALRDHIADGTNLTEAGGTGDHLTAVATAASISALNDLSAAQVNAEVVDALNTDTYAEPGQGTPGATISLAAKIGYLYKAWRNRSTQTSTTYSLYNDDATTVDQKATVSDNGTTADKGEVATGP